MERILIVSGTKKNGQMLTEMLKQMTAAEIVSVSTAEDARQTLAGGGYDLCVINTPLPGTSGAAFAGEIAREETGQVILLVKAEEFVEISSQVEEHGVVTVAKPVNRSLFQNTLKVIQIVEKKMRRMQNEKQELLQRIEDIRLVDRAKYILVSYLSMTESEAHRYITQRAMDMRATKREVAQEILKTYGN